MAALLITAQIGDNAKEEQYKLIVLFKLNIYFLKKAVK